MPPANEEPEAVPMVPPAIEEPEAEPDLEMWQLQAQTKLLRRCFRCANDGPTNELHKQKP